MNKASVSIERVPIELFTEEEIDFYFDNKLARSLCYKISSYNHTNCKDDEVKG